MKELWQPVAGWEGLYEVSDQGNVRSVDRPVRCVGGSRIYPGSVLNGTPDKDGYRRVCLSRKNRKSYLHVHRLVLMTFIGPCPKGFEACHRNGLQDDNRLQNLKWDTHKANCWDKVKHGTAQRGERGPSAKLTAQDVREIRLLLEEGVTQKVIALKFGVTQVAISRIKVGKSWKH